MTTEEKAALVFAITVLTQALAFEERNSVEVAMAHLWAIFPQPAEGRAGS